jgi:hypothetical protein
VVGFAIQQAAATAFEASKPAKPTQPSGADGADELRALYGGLDTKLFPATRATARYVPGTSMEAEFAFGLDLLVDGLTHLLADQRASSTASAPRRGRASR